MAIKPFNQIDLDNLIAERDKIQGELESSPTAFDYSGGKAPTTSDLYKDASLTAINKQIEKMKGQQISERWYGKGKEETAFTTGKENQGFFSKTLDVINIPLMGIVGAVQGLTGTGKKEGILENIDYNVREGKQLFGDVLAKAGVPLAGPLGFVADITFDPINWLTMGSAALVPRVVSGVRKGTKLGGLAQGLKAAEAGATSRLGQVALNIADWIPTISKTEDAKYAIHSLAKTETAKKFGEKIIGKATRYKELTGTDPLENLGSGILGLTHTQKGKGITRTVGEFTEDAIKKLFGEEKGAKVIKTFKYSPMEKSQEARLFDEMLNQVDLLGMGKASKTSRLTEDELEKLFVSFKTDAPKTRAALDTWKKELIDPYARPSAKKKLMSNLSEGLAESGKAAETRNARVLAGDDALANEIVLAGEAAEKLSNEATMLARLKNPTGWESFDIAGYKLADKVKDIGKKNKFRTDLVEEGQRLKEIGKPIEKLNDLEKAAIAEADSFDAFLKESISSGKITAEVARDSKKLKEFLSSNKTAGEGIIEFYDFMGKLFKFGKVGASPSAIVNAYIGNPMMYFAAGGDLSKAYADSLYNAFQLSRNKATPAMIYKMILSNENFLKNALKYDTYFKSTYGAGLTDLTANLIDNAAVAEGRAAGLLAAGEDAYALIREVRGLKDTIARAIDMVDKGRTGTTKVSVPSEAVNSLIKEIQKSKGGLAFKPKVQNLLQAEVYGDLDKFDAVRKWIKDQADQGNAAAMALHKVTNTLANAFEKSDQVSKLGTAIHMSGHGLSEEELIRMSRVIPLYKSDIVGETTSLGKKYYKIDFAKATDAVNEIYMNYAAMPTAVKVMRSVPLLNSPFISFSYAMLPKFGKALIHNPAAFNKMNFAMKEMQPDKSPLERKALESKYYNWYNSPGMVRLPDLPFFSENPIYMNIASMNPFYSMSIGGETKRKYKDSTLEQVSATLDKLGLFQNPVAQVIKDYGILPALMARDEVPQGSFGQVLYPRDATGTERLGYAARAIADAYTPNVLSMIGGTAAGLSQGVLPQSVKDLDIAKYIPGYQGRNIAYAMQGKSSIGIPTTEDPLKKTSRAMMSSVGLPTHPLDLTYLSSQVKKNIKK